MSTEQNRAIVLQACHALGNSDLDALFALFADDGSWTVAFRSDRFEFGGKRDNAGMRALLVGFLGAFEHFSMRVLSTTAEEDRVAVEALSSGVTAAGARYDNNYVLMFRLQDGKIQSVHERFDPYEVAAFLEQLATA